MREPRLPSWSWPCHHRGRGSQVAMSPAPRPWRSRVPSGDILLPAWGLGCAEPAHSRPQAAGVLLGRWCQVPGGGPSSRSPLRPLLEVQTRTCQGRAGGRLLIGFPEGRGNEGWVRGGSRSGSSGWESGRGRVGPTLKSPSGDPLRWCSFHRPSGNPWTEGRWAKV